ncbi:DUF6292 family protein [Nonomuraea sp. NPDC050153]|uniref:DUF6292 family protein n=1 Tax=Nonomuraea sp. NPDC050153 TaxID=3364359 RepID=UPI00378A0349
MIQQERIDPRGYVEAVAGALRALDADVSNPRPVKLDPPIRAMRLWPSRSDYWDNEEFEDAFQLTIEWDEEYGWHLYAIEEPGAVRGMVHVHYEVGLGLVPEPDLVARRIQEALTGESNLFTGRGRRLREAATHDPELEARLASHLPS